MIRLGIACKSKVTGDRDVDDSYKARAIEHPREPKKRENITINNEKRT